MFVKSVLPEDNLSSKETLGIFFLFLKRDHSWKLKVSTLVALNMNY